MEGTLFYESEINLKMAKICDSLSNSFRHTGKQQKSEAPSADCVREAPSVTGSTNICVICYLYICVTMGPISHSCLNVGIYLMITDTYHAGLFLTELVTKNSIYFRHNWTPHWSINCQKRKLMEEPHSDNKKCQYMIFDSLEITKLLT